MKSSLGRFWEVLPEVSRRGYTPVGYRQAGNRTMTGPARGGCESRVSTFPLVERPLFPWIQIACRLVTDSPIKVTKVGALCTRTTHHS